MPLETSIMITEELENSNVKKVIETSKTLKVETITEAPKAVVSKIANEIQNVNITTSKPITETVPIITSKTLPLTKP